MKILHVIPSMDLKFGGPRTSVPELAYFQKKAGFDVSILTTFPSEQERENTFNEWGVSLHGFIPLISNRWGVSLKLWRWIWQHVHLFELVHIHFVFSFTSWVVAHACRARSVPFVISPRGLLDHYGMSQKQFKKRLAFWACERANLMSAAAVHATSDYERSEILACLNVSSVTVIPSGTLEPKFTNFEDRDSTCSKPTIIFFGRIHPKKGIEILLESLQILQTKNIECRCVIVGSGAPGYERKLKEMARQRELESVVEWRGFLTGIEKTKALLGATCFVLPSYDENFGVSAIEAMACGVPVVISENVGIVDWVRPSGAGLVCRRDSGEFASAIEWILTHPVERKEISENARRLVETHFRWPTIVKQFSEFYSIAIQTAKRGM